ncbi:MAG: M48 family metallopeptidase [Candidatus Omnitrophica bacterium]|nr:M48 family metallopeptidase [Candidatus Omnitrophota bacterium]
MNTETSKITVSGIPVDIVRKDIKNLHVGVYPPMGRVRVAAPLAVNDDAVRLAVVGKLAWIKKQRARFEAQPRQSKREMISGESHYFLGRRYRLRVIEQDAPPRVEIRTRTRIDLYVRPNTPADKREEILNRWYRQELKSMVPPLLVGWQETLGVRANDWGIKKMKTKWGACNIEARRIWLNLELAKKPVQCLEYIIVHELVHLLERHHNDNFTALMNKFYPHWRSCREELNRAPLGHADWEY